LLNLKTLNLKSLLLLSIFFYSIFSFSQNNTEELTSGQQTVSTIGDVLLFGMPIAAGLTTIIIKDKEGSWQFAKGFLVNQALTIGLKAIVQKPRPDLSNNNAFPSGHTSTTFQSAAFIQKRYGWKYGIPAYALAGFTAYSRIAAKKHDGWDVAAGIVIGVGSSYLFTTPYQKEHFELSFDRTQYNDYLVGITYKF
jgi:membrane-associated phospholipid phosphatase